MAERSAQIEGCPENMPPLTVTPGEDSCIAMQFSSKASKVCMNPAREFSQTGCLLGKSPNTWSISYFYALLLGAIILVDAGIGHSRAGSAEGTRRAKHRAAGSPGSSPWPRQHVHLQEGWVLECCPPASPPICRAGLQVCVSATQASVHSQPRERSTAVPPIPGVVQFLKTKLNRLFEMLDPHAWLIVLLAALLTPTTKYFAMIQTPQPQQNADVSPSKNSADTMAIQMRM